MTLESEGIPTCHVQSSECHEPIDVILVSSNGQKYGAHKRYLDLFSKGFPSADDFPSSVACECAPLTEDSNVVDLMLHFMHRNQRHPDLTKCSFKTVMKLSEAVEKYEIYGAQELCKQQLLRVAESNLMGDNCIDVLAYAIRHDYKDLANKAALAAISCTKHPLYRVVEEYQNMPDLIVPWVRYYSAYHNIAISIMSDKPAVTGLHKGGIEDCEEWVSFIGAVRHEFGFKLENLFRFGEICEKWYKALEGCEGGQCRKRATRWIGEICSKIENIPTFLSISTYNVEREGRSGLFGWYY